MIVKSGLEKKSSMLKAAWLKGDLHHRREGFCTKLQIQELKWPSLCIEES